jgi:hypothetical membrane protein
MSSTQPTSTDREYTPPRIESLAIAAGLISAALAFVVALLVQRGQLAPLGGTGSVAAVALPSVAVTSAGAFIWAYIRHADGGVRWRRRHPVRRVLDVLGLTLTGVGVAVLLTASMLEVFGLAFVGLELNAVTTAALTASFAGVSAYVLSLIAGQLTSSTLATLLSLFLVAGVFTSMLTADDQQWWQRNFSALGMGTATSSYTFNLTILIAGLAILALSDYLTIDLLERRTGGRRGVWVIRTALALVGVALIGVGLVPVNISVIAHNSFSTLALVGFAALIVLTPMVLRGLSVAFLLTTALVGVLIVTGTVLFALGEMNLTALELIAVLVIFSWLILFTRSASSGRGTTATAEND